MIGMTAMPEAKLAREAELSFCNVAMVTDFDAWHPHHEAVDVSQVVAVMASNVALAKKFVLQLAKKFPREHVECTGGSNRALNGAIMTAREKRDPALVAKLKTICRAAPFE